MVKNKTLNIVGQILLFLAAFVWGTSFLILKSAIDELPPLYVLAIRFFGSAIIIGLIFIKKTIKISKSTFFRGAIIGLSIFFAYLTQTYGLMFTTPGQNAFITSLYCVMTPFFMWGIYKVKPKAYNIVAAVLCVIGVALIAVFGDSKSGTNVMLGNFLTFLGAIFYALQVIFIDKFSKASDDPMQVLTVELFVIGLLFVICSATIEIPIYGIESFALDKSQIIKLLYLLLACTLFAQFAQFIGQKLTTANQAAILLSLEGVFGTLFSVVFGTEKMTVVMGIGFGVIFIGTLTSELKPDFKKLIKGKKYKDMEKKKVEEKNKMTHTIDNGNIKLTVSTHGAEIINVIKDGKEHTWQNETGEWAGHAHILFPMCGHVKVIENGRTLPVYSHGVARISEFIVEDSGKDFIKLTTHATSETKKYYPFDFEFSVVYTLIENAIKVEYVVKNLGKTDMYFATGGHDTFELDGELEEYFVEFEKEEHFVNLTTDNDGYLDGGKEDFGTGKIVDFAKTPILNNQTLIFANVNSRKVVLKKKSGETVGEAEFDGYQNILFWRPGTAKMVCMEPWQNLPDPIGDDTTLLKDKAGFTKLSPAETKTFTRFVKYY